jgi:glutaredoxin-related protein
MMKPGTGVGDLSCPIDDLIEQVVQSHRVVAFIKGTRTEPACGFSFKVPEKDTSTYILMNLRVCMVRVLKICDCARPTDYRVVF